MSSSGSIYVLKLSNLYSFAWLNSELDEELLMRLDELAASLSVQVALGLEVDTQALTQEGDTHRPSHRRVDIPLTDDLPSLSVDDLSPLSEAGLPLLPSSQLIWWT